MDHVLVIGGSFAGLSAALQLVRTGRRVTVLDTKLPRNRFAHAAQGLLGFDGVSPWDIRRQGEANVLAYPTASIVKARAVSARVIDGGFAVTDEAGTERQAQRLILAYGQTDVMVDIPGFAECWGNTVVPCPYCHGYEVANQRLGLLYSSAMSLHGANLIRDWSERITLFTDGNDIPDEERHKLAARGIALVEGKVAELAHTTGKIAAVVLTDGARVELDTLFAHTRSAPSSNLHETLGLETVDGPMGPYIKITEKYETSLAGVYAAGDSASLMPNLNLALASGAMAGVMCHQSMLG
ncbi:MAG: NAD(P)/FAD-dependent oxidoreductase [Devosia sp.]|uniref:NAD(P)/FAD-dependent oxidoreductase n=1 Tax=Devosia sp. TaxID=1871048 RepID=UPI0026332300|nr:NAD(P)/FAD-dependent oxidoreductase [Devosia sp.]MDB5585617.1 NAD(P)/FAD-dependent oxidoreductase [Devosia sp.]